MKLQGTMLAVMLASSAVAASPVAAQTVNAGLQPGETLLEVQAEGEAHAQPDRANISAGVVTAGKTTAEVLVANVAAVERLMSAIRVAGVPARDIQTQQIRIQPQYQQSQYGRDQSVITGYNAVNQVSVQLRDLAKAPQVIAALFNAGANDVNGPYFSLSDDRRAVAGARADAVAKAKVEAEAYAAAFGMRVARVLRVSERGHASHYDSSAIVVTGSRAPPPPPPPPPPPAIGAVPISIGQVRTAATLWVDFALVAQ